MIVIGSIIGLKLTEKDKEIIMQPHQDTTSDVVIPVPFIEQEKPKQTNKYNSILYAINYFKSKGIYDEDISEMENRLNNK